MAEAENVIDSEFAKVEKLILEFPIPLLGIENSKILAAIDSYLPYSIGIEFECFQKDRYDILAFESIPNIMDVNIDSAEQRYRIPSGLKGLVCLYHICMQMKINSELDLRSSNHYHFDFTDIEERESIKNKDNEKYILDELVKWGTALNLSQQDNWIRFFNCLGTLEIRIGEPTFEYNVIIKRLIDGCRISKFLKDVYHTGNDSRRLLKLQAELDEINKIIPCKESENVNEIIKKRTFKI